MTLSLLDKCHKEAAYWKGIEAEASGACLQACLPHEFPRHTSHTERPRRRSKSRSPELSHTHHTVFSSSLYNQLLAALFFSSFVVFLLVIPNGYRYAYLKCRLRERSSFRIGRYGLTNSTRTNSFS